jgi:hypothetical protein
LQAYFSWFAIGFLLHDSEPVARGLKKPIEFPANYAIINYVFLSL